MPGMGPSSETTPREAPVSLHEVEYDVRRKRPPALSFLLRWETARRIGRVGSLLALDFAAVFLAIFTALRSRPSRAGSGARARCWRRRSSTSPSPSC